MPRIPPEPEENRQSSTDVNAPLPSQLTDLGSNGISSISIRKRILAAIIISLGGIPFGYDLGALSGGTQCLLHRYTLPPAQLGLTVSTSLWGALFTSFFAGYLADRMGRRALLGACAIVFAISTGLLGLPFDFTWKLVVVLRLLSGMTIGGMVVVCPLFLAEIAPRAIRGRLVSWFQMQICVGIVLAFAANAILARTVGAADISKWLFRIGALPPICLLSLLPCVPEEPHCLARRGKWRKAKEATAWFDIPFDGLLAENCNQLDARPAKLPTERLFQGKYVRGLFLATSVALFNQLSGVNVLRVYLLDVLANEGIGRIVSHNYAVMISCFNLIFLSLGTALVDWLGRRPLLVIGSAGMSFCMLAMSFAGTPLVEPRSYIFIIIVYNAFFIFSQGAVAWTYLSELFPFSVRGKGQSYGASIHWIVNAALIMTFPVLAARAHQRSFLLFAFAMALQIAVVLLFYPETNGKRLGSVVQEETVSG